MFYELSNGDTYTCAGLGSRKGEREGGVDEARGVASIKMEDVRII